MIKNCVAVNSKPSLVHVHTFIARIQHRSGAADSWCNFVSDNFQIHHSLTRRERARVIWAGQHAQHPKKATSTRGKSESVSVAQNVGGSR